MLNFFRNILIFLITPWSVFSAYNLSVCSIFRDEAPFLKEWIEFHRLQGVQHFFLYNHCSKDDFYPTLQPYIKNNIVTLVNWSHLDYNYGNTKEWHQIQRSAYNHCLKKFGSKTIWLAVIDIDEFIFCPNGENLPIFLKRYNEFAGVCVNWLMFGTSNINAIPTNSLLIESLTRCAPKDYIKHRTVKSIIQTKYTKKIGTHISEPKKGKKTVNALKKTVTHNELKEQTIPIDHERIRINHYWTRDKKFYDEHKKPSFIQRGRKEKLKRDIAYLNRDSDTQIQQFVPILRKLLGYQ